MPRKKASEMTPDELARYRESERLRNQRRVQYKKEWQASNKDRAAEYVKRHKEKNAEALREKARRKYEEKTLESGAYLALHVRSCNQCSKTFLTRWETVALCSEACRVEDRRTADWNNLACKQCGSSFSAPPTLGNSPKYCSDVCRNVVKAAQKRSVRLLRKAMLRAATVERVDPHKVFDRDNWTCQMCSVVTPRELRGTYDKDAPELDHIIPLARGGAHSYANTQCLCRACNAMKSDRLDGWRPPTQGRGQNATSAFT